MRARYAGLPCMLALALGAIVPASAGAQVLDRTSRVVRSPGAAAAPRGRGGGSLGGSRGGSRGGGARAIAPRGGSVVVAPPRRSAAPRPIDPSQGGSTPSDRGAPGDIGWATPWWGGGASSGTVVYESTTTVAPAPVVRDPMLGGSAGVRATGPIGIAPAREPPPNVVAATPAEAFTVEVVIEEDEPPPSVRAVVGFDAGYVLGHVARGAIGGRIEFPHHLELLFDYTGFFEPNDDGFDALALGRLGIGLRLIDERAARLAIGVALRHFQDWLGPRFGVDGRLGIEVEVAPSIVLCAEGSIGSVGEAFAAGVRGTLNGRFGGVEVFAGYDHLTLQSVDRSVGSVDLGGPIAGMRVWIE